MIYNYLDPWGDGGIGRRRGLKILRWKHLVGSTPTRPTCIDLLASIGMVTALNGP